MLFNMGGGGRTRFEYKIDSDGKWVSISADGTFTFPTIDSEGNVADTSLLTHGANSTERNWLSNCIQAIMTLYKHVVIPDYYTTVQLVPYTSWQFCDKLALEHLYIGAQVISFPAYNQIENNLTMVELPNANVNNWDPGAELACSNGARTKDITIYAPHVKNFGGYWTSNGQTYGVIPIVPEATRIGGTNGAQCFNRYWKSCSLLFQSCTEIIQIEQGIEEQTMRFPKLTTCTNNNQFRQDWSHGKFIWCVGKDLTSFAAQIATNINNAAGQIEVHIPAGASTTLTTLQTAGVNSQYIYQDYGTDLYPEDAQYFS